MTVSGILVPLWIPYVASQVRTNGPLAGLLGGSP